MGKQKLKARIAVRTLLSTLSFILIFSGIFIWALMILDRLARDNVAHLGDAAVAAGSQAFEANLKDNMQKHAQDTGSIIEENLIRLENLTTMLASSVTDIYTRADLYKPRKLVTVESGALPPAKGIPFVHAAPGVSLERIRAETELVSNCADTMRQFNVISSNILSGFVAGESGYIIAIDNVSAPSVDYIATSRAWYQMAKTTGHIAWTDVYVDMRGRGIVIACAAPIYDVYAGRKAFKGVAGCNASVISFENIIKDANIWGDKGGTHVFLLDRQGRKLFSSDGSGVYITDDGKISGENYLESDRFAPLARSMTAGENGFIRVASTVPGTYDYAAYHSLSRLWDKLGWSVGVYLDGTEITRQVDTLRTNVEEITLASRKKTENTAAMILSVIVFAAIVIIILTLISLSRFAGGISRPILECSEMIEKLGGGNLNYAQEIHTDNEEMERLVGSFTAMTGRIDSYIREISQISAKRQQSLTESQLAAEIQRAALPKPLGEDRERQAIFDLYATLQNAKEVRGAFYDFFFLDKNQFVMIIGDISGSGVKASLTAVLAKTMLHAYIKKSRTLEEAFSETNREICAQNGEDGRFVRVWAGILDMNAGKLRFIDAGNNPPFVKSGGMNFGLLAVEADSVLGFMEDTTYHCRETSLKTGDILFLYTDGVIAAFNADEEQYGALRLRKTLDLHERAAMRELLTKVKEDIDAFLDDRQQTNDIAMLGIRLL